jgi:hypothetical protein
VTPVALAAATQVRSTVSSTGTGTGWSWQDAAAAAESALGPRPDLVLVRDASAVVFCDGDVAVKVNAPGTDVARMRATYDALRESTSCLLPLAGPYATPGGIVTVWPWLDHEGTTTWPELGRLVRALHDTAGPTTALPHWRPFSRLAQQLEAVPSAEAAILRRAARRLLRQANRMHSDLGHGLIHGDVSLENTLRSGGQPVLIDLDFVAIGPREYDLVGALLRLRRGELDQATYDGFCAAYGADVSSWSGLPLVVDVCDLGALTFQLWAAAHRGEQLPPLDGLLDRWR